MNQIEQQVNCHTCQWNKMCVEPPSMTKEEIEKLTKVKEDEPDKEKALFGGLMTTLVFAGKDSQGKLCPIFAEKLRESPELTNKIKEIMKSL